MADKYKMVRSPVIDDEEFPEVHYHNGVDQPAIALGDLPEGTDHSTLSNVTIDQHHARDHSTRHLTGGGDALSLLSADLASIVTDETGSGSLVFGTSPTLVTPALGTPSSGTLTNCTGLPVVGGGTGASTAAGARTNLNVGYTFAYSTTTSGNTHATNEIDLYAPSITGGTLANNGEAIEFWFAGTLLGHATATRQLKVKFGATTIFDSTAQNNTVNYDFSIRGMIIRTGTATQKCITYLNTTTATLFTFADYATSAETLSGAIVLKITGQAGGVGAAIDDIKLETAKVYFTPAP